MPKRTRQPEQVSRPEKTVKVRHYDSYGTVSYKYLRITDIDEIKSSDLNSDYKTPGCYYIALNHNDMIVCHSVNDDIPVQTNDMVGWNPTRVLDSRYIDDDPYNDLETQEYRIKGDFIIVKLDEETDHVIDIDSDIDRPL